MLAHFPGFRQMTGYVPLALMHSEQVVVVATGRQQAPSQCHHQSCHVAAHAQIPEHRLPRPQDLPSPSHTAAEPAELQLSLQRVRLPRAVECLDGVIAEVEVVRDLRQQSPVRFRQTLHAPSWGLCHRRMPIGGGNQQRHVGQALPIS